MNSRLLLCLAAATALAGCARPGWLTLPDADATPVAVEEVARANVCHTVSGESDLLLLSGTGALESLAQSRGFQWVRTSTKALAETLYVVIEHGQRTNGGYGLAVSRDAELRGDVLVLRATYFEPQQGRWASNQPSSPCVAVALPAGASYSSIRVQDQDGRVRVRLQAGGA